MQHIKRQYEPHATLKWKQVVLIIACAFIGAYIGSRINWFG
jgi:uncharacterized membrane protein YfcA